MALVWPKCSHDHHISVLSILIRCEKHRLQKSILKVDKVWPTIKRFCGHKHFDKAIFSCSLLPCGWYCINKAKYDNGCSPRTDWSCNPYHLVWLYVSRFVLTWDLSNVTTGIWLLESMPLDAVVQSYSV